MSDVALSHAATWNYHVGFMRVQWLLVGENEKNKWDKILLATSLTRANCGYLQVRSCEALILHMSITRHHHELL